jgi:hypothetical protein
MVRCRRNCSSVGNKGLASMRRCCISDLIHTLPKGHIGLHIVPQFVRRQVLNGLAQSTLGLHPLSTLFHIPAPYCLLSSCRCDSHFACISRALRWGCLHPLFRLRPRAHHYLSCIHRYKFLSIPMTSNRSTVPTFASRTPPWP